MKETGNIVTSTQKKTPLSCPKVRLKA